MVSWIQTFFYIIILFYICWFFFFRKHIIPNCIRDIEMIFRHIQNLIWICGWRLDLQVDPMEIRFIISRKLRSRMCEQVIASWLLGPHGPDRANNHWPSKQSYKNMFKLRRPNLVLRDPTNGKIECYQVDVGISHWYLCSTSLPF